MPGSLWLAAELASSRGCTHDGPAAVRGATRPFCVSRRLGLDSYDNRVQITKSVLSLREEYVKSINAGTKLFRTLQNFAELYKTF